MITALVQFQLGSDATAASAAAIFRSTAPLYQGLPGLIRKYYLFDPLSRRGGGCYLFDNRAAATAAFDDRWRARVTEKYGGSPEITYFETPVVVDNRSHEIIGLDEDS